MVLVHIVFRLLDRLGVGVMTVVHLAFSQDKKQGHVAGLKRDVGPLKESIYFSSIEAIRHQAFFEADEIKVPVGLGSMDH